MGLHQTPLLIASLLLCIGSTSGLSSQQSCPPSSCGNLQIRYPFRLKGDKPTCGDRRYELTCDGNRTIIASFVNCTREFQSEEYKYVPCLSGGNAFVYVLLDGTVGFLAHSCRFLAMVPTDGRFFMMDATEADVLEYLQNGFSLKWVNPSCHPVPFIIEQCYEHAL